MDPQADKVMVVTAMCSMAIGNKTISAVIPWAAVVILFVKELIMVIGSAVMLRYQIVVYSTMVGKVAQCMFIASLVAVYFHDWFVELCAGWLMPLDLIIGAYQAIFPGVDGLFGCLLMFNVPFTFLKGALNTLLAFLIYKHISPLIKGKHT